MIRTVYRPKEGGLQFDAGPEELRGLLEQEGGLLWVDLAGEPPEKCERLLNEVFGFHHLAVEDALRQSHVPKVDDWDGYLYLVLHDVDFDRENCGRVQTRELDLFLGRNYLVTYQEVPLPPVEKVLEECRRDDRHLSHGADYLAYALADELASAYMPVVDDMVELIDAMEDQVITGSSPETLQQILQLKHAVLHLQRIMSPQREVLNKLARDEYAVVDRRTRVYFRDVYDHYVRLQDILESLRDLVTGALDIYLSVVNNRMNDVMKTLTIITTVFMPVSFIAGVFGMNFFQSARPLGLWSGRTAFWVTAGAMVLTTLGMLWWMRKRKWM